MPIKGRSQFGTGQMRRRGWGADASRRCGMDAAGGPSGFYRTCHDGGAEAEARLAVGRLFEGWRVYRQSSKLAVSFLRLLAEPVCFVAGHDD